jgi:hypothetical protein
MRKVLMSDCIGSTLEIEAVGIECSAVRDGAMADGLSRRRMLVTGGGGGGIGWSGAGPWCHNFARAGKVCSVNTGRPGKILV